MGRLSLLKEYAAHRDGFWAEAATHVALAFGSLLAAALVGLPLGIACARRPRLRGAALPVLNVIQTIPSIAMYGLMMVPLGLLAGAVPLLGALGIRGIGAAPAALALFLYALLPVVANTAVGLDGVPRDAVEAARGMGMGDGRRLRTVELPLAAPVILTGIRIVLVQNIGLVTVAALIGGGGFGTFVFQGTSQAAIDLVLLGAVPTVILAFAAAVLLDAAAEAARGGAGVIEIEGVSRRFGDTLAVDDVSLRVEAGTVTALVGTSGSGKSTLLRMINRLIEPSAGTIRVDGRDTASVPGEALRRGIGYAIQGHGLFPHWTVARNIGTVPALLGWDKARVARRTDELLRLFDLDPGLYAGKFPHELSGGQQQRVGVARALAAEPKLLLMDEPFGALDPIIRAKAQADLVALQRRLGITVVLVTHDMEEAILLGHRIGVMDRGRLLQYAPPAELLARPAPGYVERLMGRADRPFQLLSLLTVADAREDGPADAGPDAAPVPEDMTLRDALGMLLWRRADSLPVAGPDGAPRGRLTLAAVLRRAGRPG